MKQLLTIIFFLFCHYIAIAQDYSKVDVIVSKYPNKFKSITDFSDRVENDFNTDIDKVRAVYYWISNHIVYDFKSLRNGSNAYDAIEMKSEEQYQNDLLKMEKKYAERSLKKQRAVCEGYAQLLKFTLLELDIETEVVSGFAKTFVYEIGKIRNNSNHAWNAVKIDNEWKLIDATWSTGIEEYKPKVFEFTDTYFLISPSDLILSHLPTENKWQLLDNSITKADFFYGPIVFERYFNSGLKLIKNTSGIIKQKTNSFIEIEFDRIDDTASYYYTFKEDNTSQELFFQKKENVYITKIPFKSKRKTELTIYSEFDATLEYKIILEK
ncbi:transglutaminase domain-containing protein [Psychroserpens sp.]